MFSISKVIGKGNDPDGINPNLKKEIISDLPRPVPIPFLIPIPFLFPFPTVGTRSCKSHNLNDVENDELVKGGENIKGVKKG